MFSRITYIVIFFSLLLGLFSCRTRKEYVERNGLHSDDKPSDIAKDMGKSSKKQKRAYLKQLRRADKAIKKRNRKKLKGTYYGEPIKTKREIEK